MSAQECMDSAISELSCADDLIAEDNTAEAEERLFRYYLASAIVSALLAVARAIEEKETGL